MPTLLSSLPAGTKSTSSETGAVSPSTVFAFVLLSSTENSGWLFSGSDWSLSSPEVVSDSSLVVSDTSAPVLSSVKSDDSPSPFPLSESASAGVFCRSGGATLLQAQRTVSIETMINASRVFICFDMMVILS